MQPYANRSGSSGVVAFALGADFIDVKFIDGDVYRYSARQPGARDVARMTALALGGAGLASFIARNVGERYESKRPA